jgi:protein SHQ1
VEDDDSSAKYDIATGILSIILTKVNAGEHFPDLDLTNRLLARTGETIDENGPKVKGPPKIQVMDTLSQDQMDEAIQFDFQMEQKIEEEERLKGAKYGFNDQYSGHFRYLQNLDILTCEDVENKSVLERWKEMRDAEDAKFDREWVIADAEDPPEELKEIMQFNLPKTIDDPFTVEEQTQLRNIGRRDCIPHLS